MPVDIDSPEGLLIRKMVPFSTMPSSIFKVICDKVVVETARSGAFLFKRGDTSKELVYLLKGEVSLEVDRLKMEVIKAGSESSRFALAHQLPRKVNGVAKGSVQYARLNSIYITTPDKTELKKSQDEPPKPKAAVAKEPIKGNAQSWLTTLLMIPILRTLKPFQLTRITEQIEEVQYEKEEIVISEGDIAEYFYIIKNGECWISCKNETPEQALIESKLKTWDSFGAESLITNNPSAYSIIAASDVSLLRINKKNFLDLIKDPLMKLVTSSEMEVLLFRGAVLIDVRPAAEYNILHLGNAINLPLAQLRQSMETLNKETPIVIFSDRQKISQTAGFLLLTQRFSVYILRDKQNDDENAKQESFDFLLDTPDSQFSRHPYHGAGIETSDTQNASHPLDDSGQIENSPEILALENAQLSRQITVLKLKVEQAEQEKQEVMHKYKVLLQEFEQLKAAFEAQTK